MDRGGSGGPPYPIAPSDRLLQITHDFDRIPLLFGIALVLVALVSKSRRCRFRFGCRMFIKARPRLGMVSLAGVRSPRLSRQILRLRCGDPATPNAACRNRCDHGRMCGFYYCLKVARAMYWLAPVNAAPIPVSMLSRLTMILLIGGIFVLGVYPKPIFEALQVV